MTWIEATSLLEETQPYLQQRALQGKSIIFHVREMDCNYH